MTGNFRQPRVAATQSLGARVEGGRELIAFDVYELRISVEKYHSASS